MCQTSGLTPGISQIVYTVSQNVDEIMGSVAICRSPDTCASPGHLCVAQPHDVPALACWVPVAAECSCVVWVLRAKTKQTLGCGSKGMAHRSREEVTALYSALVGPHLDQMLCRSLGSPILKGLGIVQQSRWRAIKLARWLIHGRWGEAERAKLVYLVKDTNFSYVFMIVGSEDPRNCASLTVGNKSLDRFCLPVTEHLEDFGVKNTACKLR